MSQRPVHAVLRRLAAQRESAVANRRWWDHEARDYYREHGTFLGDERFVWGPEGLDEADARLLGAVTGLTVLEVGAGAAQCSRWLGLQGARPVAVDLSIGMLRQGRAVESGRRVPMVQADACALPLGDDTVDVACSAYGAVPFVSDSATVMSDVARVLRPGGRWVFSTTHPFRWCFRDDPGPNGLVVESSYFDRRAYVEQDGRGRATYVEHHRTVGDRVREIVGAGLVLDDIVEPEWPDGHDQAWEQWSPLRGRLMPGTVIFVTRKPDRLSD